MRLLLATAILAITTISSMAQPASRSWETWTRDGSCFAILFPKDGAIEELNTPKAYLSIKHTPAEQARNAIAIVSGLEDTDGLAGRADVDGKLFELLIYNGNGYVKTGDREDALVAALMAGKELRVTWSGPAGMTVQTYDLEGVTQAKRTIDASCYPQSE